MSIAPKDMSATINARKAKPVSVALKLKPSKTKQPLQKKRLVVRKERSPATVKKLRRKKKEKRKKGNHNRRVMW